MNNYYASSGAIIISVAVKYKWRIKILDVRFKDWFVEKAKALICGIDDVEITVDEDIKIFGTIQHIDVIIRNKKKKDREYNECWDAEYFCFGKSDKDLKCRITYINNQTQYNAALFGIMENVLRDYDWKIFNKKKVLTEYAEDFYRYLLEDEQLLKVPECIEGLLPILFYEKNCNENEDGTCTVGSVHSINVNKQKVIKIYGLRYRDIEELKITIRHEIIHFTLACANLKNEDDSAIFHILCQKYDAHEYKPLTEEEEKLYTKFMGVKAVSTVESNNVSKEFVQNVLRIIGLKPETMTPVEENIINDLVVFEEYGNLILEKEKLRKCG